MTTTSSEAATRAASPQPTQVKAVHEAQRLLALREAGDEPAIAKAGHAFSEFLWALFPGAVTRPTRAVDLALGSVRDSLNLQRRLLHELLAALQAARIEAGWRNFDVDVQPATHDRVTRTRTARTSA